MIQLVTKLYNGNKLKKKTTKKTQPDKINVKGLNILANKANRRPSSHVSRYPTCLSISDFLARSPCTQATLQKRNKGCLSLSAFLAQVISQWFSQTTKSGTRHGLSEKAAGPACQPYRCLTPLLSQTWISSQWPRSHSWAELQECAQYSAGLPELA